MWYWPFDFPSASRTRLGSWKTLFEGEGVRFENFFVGSLSERGREYERGSWTLRYWFYTKTLWRRWRQFFALRRYDVVWIDRWFLPDYPMKSAAFERCIKRMVRYLVIDSSDGTDFIGNPSLVLDVMGVADKVTVAYKGLYEFYAPRFRRVERFEYPILEEGYRVRTDHPSPSRFTLGWMGSPANFSYLKEIESQLRLVAARHPFDLVVICRQRLELDIPGAAISYHSYGSDYFDLIGRFDIGLVPFTANDFGTSGKIGMKHQEFLLCAVPQVCSPVGISEYVVHGEHALVADTVEDWSSAILRLMEEPQLRSRLAHNGRKLCLDRYTVESQWPAVWRALTSFEESKD